MKKVKHKLRPGFIAELGGLSHTPIAMECDNLYPFVQSLDNRHLIVPYQAHAGMLVFWVSCFKGEEIWGVIITNKVDQALGN